MKSSFYILMWLIWWRTTGRNPLFKYIMKVIHLAWYLNEYKTDLQAVGYLQEEDILRITV